MGRERTSSISSTCVKSFSCFGTSDGIIELSKENNFGNILSLVQREQIYGSQFLGLIFSGQASLQILH